LVNLILKFERNSKSGEDAQLVAFFKKRVNFIHKGSKVDVKSGEYWECFVWDVRDKYNLVKPYRKIDPENLKEDIVRVREFNIRLSAMEKFLNADFERVIFDEYNNPFLLSKLDLDKTKEKYKDYKVVELDGKVVALPPIPKK
jgi:hypothetical protein